MRALTEEAAHPVDARRPVEAGRARAIVDVHAAIGPRPAVHAYARVASMTVRTRGTVVTEGRPYRAFVDVVLALGPGERGRTEARVLVHPVNARSSVLAQIAHAVVDVDVALVTFEACN